ncbi:hypothetical protein [Actinoplanes sp. NPDC089786]|uniref:hypothetical protein n=1 Tax=Actinoplanes sp. NPDC089786 TaxID=3155185 RepID=UPI00341359B2
MLKNAWYLITHADFFAGIPDAPRLPQAPDLMATLDWLFGEDAGISPAHTATAVEVMLRMAEHLSDAVPHGRHLVADGDQLARLLNGVNLLLAHLAQLSGRLAHQVDNGTGADLSVLPDSDRAELAKAVAAASCRLEEAAGLVMEAHLRIGGAAMTTTGDAHTRISDLRAETNAAIEQRDVLAADARRALIAEFDAGRICRTSCADALTGWGLEPPPGELTMSAAGQMSYTRMHTGEDDARNGALRHVPPTLYRLLPQRVAIWPRWVVEVILIPGGDDYPEADPYRITVQVGLRVTVTATSQAAAITSAEAMVNARLPELADAGVTLTGLTWHVEDGPEDLIHAADPEPQPATVRPAAAGDDLAAATAARDAAIEAFADLRRQIRHRAVTALVTEEIGGEYEQTAERVERFLLDLGFDRLPRAYFVAVTVEVTLRVRAANAQEAYGWVCRLMEPTSAAGAWRGWTAHGSGTADVCEADGWRRVIWRHVYELSLRLPSDRAAAAAAGEALIQAEVVRTLAGIDCLMVVTGEVEGYGIDQRLDPDTD